MPTEFDEGVLVGVLVGEGHFGGDGRQPHVTLRMHERHEALFRWIERTFPGGRLYGPYNHGGRRYYQWMARAAYLRDSLLPLLERRLTPEIDRYAFERFDTMRTRYRRQLRRDTGDATDTRSNAHHLRPATSNGLAPAAGEQAPAITPRPGAGPAATGTAGTPGTADRAARLFAQLRDPDGQSGTAPA